MKILAPVNSLQEVSTLIKRGAQEIYCGVQPSNPKNASTNSFTNRRTPQNASIKDLKVLKKVVNEAHAKDVKVFLTLNQPSYRPDLFPKLLELAKETVDLGIDALIIGDPALMSLVKKNIPDAVIHVSSLSGILNSESIKFFRDLGASRIIFPRYISLEDLKSIIVKTHPPLEYEVFILNDGCVYEESYCHASHAFGGGFCHTNWTYKLEETNIRQKPQRDEDFQRHIVDYKNWHLHGISSSMRPCGKNGFPLGMCGLCALPELYRLGVSSIKIVGRESPIIKKAASVSIVKIILDRVKAGDDEKSIQETAKRLRGAYRICESKYACYYR